MKDEVDFLPESKDQRFFQIDTIILPKITSLLFLCNILRKKRGMKLIFLDADKHESLLQINTMILMGMFKHSQSFQNSKFAMSLQYLKKSPAPP